MDRRRPASRLLLVGLLVFTLLVLAGCGGPSRSSVGGAHLPPPPSAPLPAGALPPSYIPLTVGPGPGYRPPPRPPSGRPVAGMRCEQGIGPRVGVHVELFANRHVILIPIGIGVVSRRRADPGASGGPCYFPLVTLDPTGVVEIRPAARPFTLGDLFAIWGEQIGSTRLAGFSGREVHAFVDGRPVGGDPAAIGLRRHDEIVLETAGRVVPHESYRFVNGL